MQLVDSSKGPPGADTVSSYMLGKGSESSQPSSLNKAFRGVIRVYPQPPTIQKWQWLTADQGVDMPLFGHSKRSCSSVHCLLVSEEIQLLPLNFTQDKEHLVKGNSIHWKMYGEDKHAVTK